jgi:hypothetical protein
VGSTPSHGTACRTADSYRLTVDDTGLGGIRRVDQDVWLVLTHRLWRKPGVEVTPLAPRHQNQSDWGADPIELGHQLARGELERRAAGVREQPPEAIDRRCGTAR